jgi:hypothetical protein
MALAILGDNRLGLGVCKVLDLRDPLISQMKFDA